MSDANFPTRTAGDLTLPNGDTVWVCQLNTLLFEEVDTEARWQAQQAARKYLKGQPRYADVLAEIKSLSSEQQAIYLSKQEYWTIDRETKEKHATPEEPQMGDKTPEEFGKAVIEWEAACKKVEEKRAKARETRWNAEVKKNAALSVAVRIEKCCVAYFAEKWAEAFVKAREKETMHRAVRHADDHTRRYFLTPEAYEDADDAVQAALREFFYVDLAEPKSEDIPTSPAAS